MPAGTDISCVEQAPLSLDVEAAEPLAEDLGLSICSLCGGAMQHPKLSACRNLASFTFLDITFAAYTCHVYSSQVNASKYDRRYCRHCGICALGSNGRESGKFFVLLLAFKIDAFQAMHAGVVRDMEQQRVKRERQADFEMQRKLEEEYKKVQTVHDSTDG